MKKKTSPKKPQPATIAEVRSELRSEVLTTALRIAISYLSEVELDDFSRRFRESQCATPPPPSRAERSRSKEFAAQLARELLGDADQVAA